MTRADRAYDRAIELAALAVIASERSTWTEYLDEAIRLRDGFVDEEMIDVRVFKQVVCDVVERATALLSDELGTEELPSGTIESALGELVREIMGDLAAKFPTRN